MEFTNYSAFVCVAAPLLLMFFFVEKRYRNAAAAILLGLVLCMMASELNGILLSVFGNDYFYVTTNITPVVEEVLKALPVIFLYYCWTEEKETLLGASFGIGVGFAIMENLCIMISNPGVITLSWAFARGLCTGVMHALTTSLVTVTLLYLGRQKGLRFLGLFSALFVGITYHAIFNTLVQSSYVAVGLALPVVTYIAVLVVMNRGKAAQRSRAQAGHEGEAEQAIEQTVEQTTEQSVVER